MTVTLCHSCHLKAHGRDSKGLNHSRLTKDGLAKSDKPLGTHNPVIQNAAKKANKERGDETYARLFPHLEAAFFDYQIDKITDIIDFLNDREVLTARGKCWTKGSIYRFIERFALEHTCKTQNVLLDRIILRRNKW